MRLLKGAFLIAVLATAGACFGDTLKGNFKIENGKPVFLPHGTVTFTLNPDGTILAILDSYVGDIVGFGFDSTFHLRESGFYPTQPENTWGWDDMYGIQLSGFSCQCGEREKWIIGTPGEFTSVFQALGGTTSQYDFFLYNSQEDEYAADAFAYVPEPASLMLLGSALLGLGGVSRKRATKA